MGDPLLSSIAAHFILYLLIKQPTEISPKYYFQFLLVCDTDITKIVQNNLIRERREIPMKKVRSSRRINKIGTTPDTITGRGGIALFSRYLETTGILDILDSKFGFDA